MALEAIRVMQAEPERVTRLHARGQYFRTACAELGLDTGLSQDSPVVPVIVGDTLQCMRLAQALFARGINVTPMVHPAVRNDEARLRFFVSAEHSEQQLLFTAQATADEFARIRAEYSGSFSRLRPVPVVEPKQAAIAREGFEAFTKGDLSVLADQLHRDAVYFFPGRSAVAGYHQGREQVLDFFASIFELTDGTLSVDLRGILSNANQAVLLWHNRARRGGSALDGMMCEILDIEGDEVVAATFYTSDQLAVDEFLGNVNRVAAVPRAHMRSAAPDENTMTHLVEQLLRGQPLEHDARVSIAPALLEHGSLPLETQLSSIHQHLLGLVRAGFGLTLDFAVENEVLGVARIRVTDENGVCGSLCLVAELALGSVSSAWLSADCEFHHDRKRERPAASNQKGAVHEIDCR
jgi:ketosteroid isomerase-like protein